jgi:mono/diheme cytochrome c family protein
MVGQKGTLSEKEVWQVVNYIRSIGPTSAPAQPAKAPVKK